MTECHRTSRPGQGAGHEGGGGEKVRQRGRGVGGEYSEEEEKQYYSVDVAIVLYAHHGIIQYTIATNIAKK